MNNDPQKFRRSGSRVTPLGPLGVLAMKHRMQQQDQPQPGVSQQGATTAMTGSPLTTMPPSSASEVQSSLTLLDFFQTWRHLRWWFLAGLILVGGGTYIFNKFFLKEYFRAEAKIFVGRNILPEQRIGIADIELSAIGRNDQFINLVQAVLAEQYLTSTKLLLDVVDGFKSGEFKKKYYMQPWDLYDLLDLKKKDKESEDYLRRKLAFKLQNSLIQVRQVLNSGMLIFSVELPKAQAAREFTNACVRVLMERFTDLEFGYYDSSLQLYRERLAREIKDSQKLAQTKVGIDLDHYPTMDQQNEILKAELEEQAKWIAQMATKISKLDLATTETAKAAGQSLKVVDWAYMPIEKCRPHCTLNSLLAAALYTFVFMLGMVVYNYMRGGRREGMQ